MQKIVEYFLPSFTTDEEKNFFDCEERAGVVHGYTFSLFQLVNLQLLHNLKNATFVGTIQTFVTYLRHLKEKHPVQCHNFL